ncbi:MAG TPA: transcriptional antiterminator [Vibrio sp.]|nr:transcriptional antiterminator [Vibrio sp.]
MISCSQYDYLEIACLYHFPIIVTLIDGGVIEGKALDTGYNDSRQECLLVETTMGEKWLSTEQLKSIEVTISNPHFSFVEFTQ